MKALYAHFLVSECVSQIHGQGNSIVNEASVGENDALAIYFARAGG